MTMRDVTGPSLLNRETHNIIVLTGDPGFVTDGPADSLGTHSLSLRLDHVQIPFLQGNAASLDPATSADWAVHFRHWSQTSSGQNDGIRAGVAGASGRLLHVSWEDGTRIMILFLNDVEIGRTTLPNGIQTWHRLILHKEGTRYRVYEQGLFNDPVIDVVDPTPLGSAPDRYDLESAGTITVHVRDLAFMDLDGAGISDIRKLGFITTYPGVPVADGEVQDQTGDFDDINELPFNDADRLEATAVDQLSNFFFTPPPPSVLEILDLQVHARIIRAGSSAGDNIQVAHRMGAAGADVFVPAAPVGAPASGQISIKLGPLDADGNPWNPATIAAQLRLGLITRT